MFYYYNCVDTSAGVIVVPKGITRQVVSSYIYVLSFLVLNNVSYNGHYNFIQE